MSGSSGFSVPPSSITLASLSAEQWVRQVPVPGNAFLNLPAVGGVATCQDLMSGSPPTLLEQYDVYSYSIGWGIFLEGVAGNANVTGELALLVNDRTAYVAPQSIVAMELGATGNAIGTGAFISDLVNPIKLGARDRLTARMGVISDTAASSNVYVVLGMQLTAPGGTLTITPFESTISYYVLDVPASRRL